MTRAEIRQAPGWWPSLVQAACGCGWHGPVRSLNEPMGEVRVKLDRDGHRCGEGEEASDNG